MPMPIGMGTSEEPVGVNYPIRGGLVREHFWGDKVEGWVEVTQELVDIGQVLVVIRQMEPVYECTQSSKPI